MANLKSNHTRASFEKYARFLDERIDEQEVFVFPPSNAFLYGKHKFIQGAQNFYPQNNGSFTGEITKDMLDEFNIDTVIIGHSERRNILFENDIFLKQKFDFALRHNWNIVYCIGENEAVFNANNTKDFLKQQLSFIDLKYQKLIIAYEPVWAIGTGKTANIDIIEDILNFLKNLSDAYLLYGGSVNIKNIAQISQIRNCDGVLVGTSSWNEVDFLNLIRGAKCC